MSNTKVYERGNKRNTKPVYLMLSLIHTPLFPAKYLYAYAFKMQHFKHLQIAIDLTNAFIHLFHVVQKSTNKRIKNLFPKKL